MKKLLALIMAMATIFAMPAFAEDYEPQGNIGDKVMYPETESINASGCKIISVSYEKYGTVVKIAFDASKINVMATKKIVCIDRATGKKYKCKFHVGFKPGQENYTDGYRYVTWVFAKFKPTVTNIDIIETEGNMLEFLNVDLTHDGTPDIIEFPDNEFRV
jgi:hypothetical protein